MLLRFGEGVAACVQHIARCLSGGGATAHACLCVLAAAEEAVHPGRAAPWPPQCLQGLWRLSRATSLWRAAAAAKSQRSGGSGSNVGARALISGARQRWCEPLTAEVSVMCGTLPVRPAAQTELREKLSKMYDVKDSNTVFVFGLKTQVWGLGWVWAVDCGAAAPLPAPRSTAALLLAHSVGRSAAVAVFKCRGGEPCAWRGNAIKSGQPRLRCTAARAAVRWRQVDRVWPDLRQRQGGQGVRAQVQAHQGERAARPRRGCACLVVGARAGGSRLACPVSSGQASGELGGGNASRRQRQLSSPAATERSC